MHSCGVVYYLADSCGWVSPASASGQEQVAALPRILALQRAGGFMQSKLAAAVDVNVQSQADSIEGVVKDTAGTPVTFSSATAPVEANFHQLPVRITALRKKEVPWMGGHVCTVILRRV